MSDRNAATIRRFYDEMWNRWELGLADEIVAPDMRFRGSLGATVVGREQFKGYVERVRAAFPDWRSEIDELIDAGDRVVARITCSGTHEGELFGVPPTGQRVSYAAVAIFRLAGGTIEEAWVVGDTQEVWRALGRLEEAGPGAPATPGPGGDGFSDRGP